MGHEPAEPFRFLPHEEFAKLSKDEKIAYLARAIEAITKGAPVVAVLIPPKDQSKQ